MYRRKFPVPHVLLGSRHHSGARLIVVCTSDCKLTYQAYEINQIGLLQISCRFRFFVGFVFILFARVTVMS
jgi:hypothetical protein